MKVINVVSIPGIGIDFYLESDYGSEICKINALLVDDVLASIRSAVEKGHRNIAVTRFDRITMNEKFFTALRSLICETNKTSNLLLCTNFVASDVYREELKYNHSAVTETVYVKPLSFSTYKKFRPETTQSDFRTCGGHFHLIESLHKGKATELTERILSELWRWYADFIALSAPSNKTLHDIGWLVHNKVFSDLLDSARKVQAGSLMVVLRPMERVLLDLLLRNTDGIVSKEQIIIEVWGEDKLGEVSDWAVNALVYRLRKSKALKDNQKIVNYKKVGYALVRA